MVSVLKNRLYDVGIIVSAVLTVAFSVLTFLSTKLGLSFGFMLVTALVFFAFFLGSVLSRKAVRNVDGVELFKYLPVKDKIFAIVSLFLIFSAVIAGCSLPFIQFGTMLMSILTGLFT